MVAMQLELEYGPLGLADPFPKEYPGQQDQEDLLLP